MAEERTIWIEHRPGKIIRHQIEPTKPKGAVEAVPIWHVKAIYAKDLEDGSAEMGESLRGGQWIEANEFVADGGLGEIVDACKETRKDRAIVRKFLSGASAAM
jgi:hypothetical protein